MKKRNLIQLISLCFLVSLSCLAGNDRYQLGTNEELDIIGVSRCDRGYRLGIEVKKFNQEVYSPMNDKLLTNRLKLKTKCIPKVCVLVYDSFDWGSRYRIMVTNQAGEQVRRSEENYSHTEGKEKLQDLKRSRVCAKTEIKPRNIIR